MEHEDNTQFDNFMQNAQHHMENLQIGNNEGVCIGIGGGDNVTTTDDLVAGIGGKFEEHDDEEWKYIQEGQQSEKLLKESNNGGHFDLEKNLHQQKQQFEDLLGGDGDNVVGNGFNSAAFGQQENLFDSGLNRNEMIDFLTSTSAPGGNSLDEEVEVIKNDGDFSTTSNTTSTAGEDDLLQQEIKIDSGNLQAEEEKITTESVGLENNEHLEEEEEGDLNSAATTTNGTSSLSENAGNIVPEENHFNQENLEENNQHLGEEFDGQKSPTDLAAFNLNPNAMEFVPNFGSNATTPTSPLPPSNVANVDIDFGMQLVGEPAIQPTVIDKTEIETISHDLLQEQQQENHLQEQHDEQQQQHQEQELIEEGEQQYLSAVPRHMAEEDDFLALSPRKGRAADMDAIYLPEEKEFEHEAAKRPHELEQEDDLSLEQLNNASSNDLVNNKNDIIAGNSPSSFNKRTFDQAELYDEDCLDHQQQQQVHSSNSFIDHGPETSVDQENDIVNRHLDKSDSMKNSVYVDNPIEDVLNSVQPLPTDTESANSSFIENDLMNDEIQQEMDLAAKELLYVEEKENISHSPSTEEFDMQFKNQQQQNPQELQEEEHFGNENHQQELPLDMKESFYMENTSSENQNNENLLANTTNPLDETSPLMETTQTIEEKILFEQHQQQQQQNENAFTQDQHHNEDLLSPSTPTEEKHLMEDTKENIANLSNDDSFLKLENQFENLNLAIDSGITSTQIEENVAENANNDTYANSDILLQHDEPQKYESESFNDEQQHYKANFEQLNQINEQQHHFNQEEISEKPFEKENEEAPLSCETKQVELQEPQEEQEAHEPPQETNERTAEIVIPENKTEENAKSNGLANEEIAAVVAGAAAIASVAAVAVSEKKTEPAAVKKSSSAVSKTAPAKPKVSSSGVTKKASEPVKKTTETAAKKPSTVGSVKSTAPLSSKPAAPKPAAPTARPKTAPPKTSAANAEKKPTPASSGTTTASKPSSGIVRKTVASTTAAKPLAASRPATSTARPATAPGASRLSTASKPATSSSVGTHRKTAAATSTTTNGVASKTSHPSTGSKPSTASASTKPTTLNVGAAAKPKATSPRTALSSSTHLRKPPTSTTTMAKSPTKPLSATTTLGGKTSSVTTTSRLTKTTVAGSSATTSVSTTSTTKTFTARPAPKFNQAPAVSTTRRSLTTTSTTSATNGSNTLKPSGAAMRKTSPNKSLSAVKSPMTKTTPSKTLSATKTSKTKEANGKSPITKPKQETPLTNGGGDSVNKTIEGLPQLNGGDLANNGAGDALIQNVMTTHQNGVADEQKDSLFENGFQQQQQPQQDQDLQNQTEAPLLNA